MSNYIIMWLVIIALSVIAEILTLGLTSIWCALSAIVSLIIAVAGGSFIVQVVVFLVLTVVQIALLRPVLKKILSFEKTDTNYTAIIGEEANVIEEIDNLKNSGRISVKGMDWLAKTKDSSIIPKGKKVKIIKIQGASLIVELIKE